VEQQGRHPNSVPDARSSWRSNPARDPARCDIELPPEGCVTECARHIGETLKDLRSRPILHGTFEVWLSDHEMPQPSGNRLYASDDLGFVESDQGVRSR
jgi:hypothetical protein